MAKFNLADMAVEICPNNRIFADDTGLPSAVVYIPKFKNSDVLTGGDDSTHPAFIVNGVEIPGFYYSKYQNVVHSGVAYSLPGEDPATRITFDAARECSEAKGHGWHLSTNAEWAAIALWCKKNGFLPYGNNDEGKDVRENINKAIPTKNGRTATGTGPLTWSHDGTEAGIWDMNGNVKEWQGGVRIVWGEIQILANNDAADPANSQDKTSTLWRAINAADGRLVEPECKTTDTTTTAKKDGATVRVTAEPTDETEEFFRVVYSTKNSTAVSQYNIGFLGNFADTRCDETIGEDAKHMLQSLALAPVEGEIYDEQMITAEIWDSEAFFIRGGGSYQGGIFCFDCTQSRSAAPLSVGFRAAYIPEE
ncbi:MAG: SUMF1/EgtB/PvdO family nonheme iron enzyme [Paludibacteraceae bacterium]|nr:SUMF1/EgtB/PvdO family nonheme iron enzyme [Paludibacteraceae bacterium]